MFPARKDGTVDPILDTNIDIIDESKTFDVEVYDFVNKNGVLHKANNTSDTKEHYLDDKSRQKFINYMKYILMKQVINLCMAYLEQ